VAAASLSSSVGGILSSPVRSSARNIFWNPASIGPIDKTEFELQLSLIGGWMIYDRAGQHPYTGDAYPSSSTRMIAGAPFLAWASPLGSERFRFAFSSYFPGGAMGQFPEDGAQRYDFISGLFLPWYNQAALAYQINDEWSVGISGIGSVAFIQLEQDVDLSPFLSEFLDEENLIREHPAMSSRASIPFSHAFGFGGSLGVLYRPHVQWSFGLSVLTPITYSFSTQMTNRAPSVAEAFGPAKAALGMSDSIENRIRVTQSTPWMLQAGMRHQFVGYWTADVFARYGFTSATNFSSVEFTDSSLIPLRGQKKVGSKARDEWMIGTLQSFHFSRRTSFAGRFEFHSNETPPNRMAITRSSFDQLNLGVAAHYRMGSRSTLGAEFAHSFMLSRRVENTLSDSELKLFQPPHSDGHYRSGVSRLGVSFRYEF
jgi:long-subunit fatty acid transport protein